MVASRTVLVVVFLFVLPISRAESAPAPHPTMPFLFSLSKGETTRVLAHPHLLAEAEMYLNACRFQKGQSALMLCHNNQSDFVVDYIDAFYNHITAQENLAYLFSGAQGDSLDLLGIAPNPIQGCAWALAIVGSGGPMVGWTDTVDAKSDCRRLSAMSRTAAEARASELVREIHIHLSSGTHGVTIIDKFP
ncbi:MAG: hypothetical protein B7Z57_11720 [Acidiphilium sp. 37-60-79]|nr:MAG: hypothetical protein B7Z57_11720 [Acidiphilium sp. 37-60-79]OZB40881.1 MAG: hypothetical protein B7X48_03390 [Acidiphilium sp. 34-60-192]